VRKPAAAAGSALFFAIAPGVVAGLAPWWLTGWRVHGPLAHWAPVRVAGLVMLILGAIVLVQAFARFVTEGRVSRPGRPDRAPGDRRPQPVCARAERPGSPSTSNSIGERSTGPCKPAGSAPATRPRGGQPWSGPRRHRR